jgi:hypothetical protein
MLSLSPTSLKNVKRCRRQRLKMVFKSEQKPLLNREQIKNPKNLPRPTEVNKEAI